MSDRTPILPKEVPTPWTAVANSWQYTTIYDASGSAVCRFDLEDWGVMEESQDRLERMQADVVAVVLTAVNGYVSIGWWQGRIDWYEGELAKADEWKAHNKALQAKVAELEGDYERMVRLRDKWQMAANNWRDRAEAAEALASPPHPSGKDS